MCSRYNLTSPPEAVRAYFAYSDRPNFPARYNIAPTQPIAVVCLDETGTRRFRLMRWGLLPAFVKDPKTFPTLINARSEEVLTKPSFRHAVRRRRCLEIVPDPWAIGGRARGPVPAIEAPSHPATTRLSQTGAVPIPAPLPPTVRWPPFRGPLPPRSVRSAGRSPAPYSSR